MLQVLILQKKIDEIDLDEWREVINTNLNFSCLETVYYNHFETS